MYSGNFSGVHAKCIYEKYDVNRALLYTGPHLLGSFQLLSVDHFLLSGSDLKDADPDAISILFSAQQSNKCPL